MNVVASSLGILVQPETLLAQLAAAQRDVRPHSVVLRRCMKVQDEYGFVFGTGLISNFLEEYYAKGDYGRPARSGSCCAPSCLKPSPGATPKRIFRRFHGRVFVDGQILPWATCSGWAPPRSARSASASSSTTAPTIIPAASVSSRFIHHRWA